MKEQTQIWIDEAVDIPPELIAKLSETPITYIAVEDGLRTELRLLARIVELEKKLAKARGGLFQLAKVSEGGLCGCRFTRSLARAVHEETAP